VCIRHGAKVKRCSSEGCANYAKNGGVCMRHGAKIKRCKTTGCTNYSVKGGVCRRHGAKVKRCNIEECTNVSVKGGVCRRHGAYRNPHEESTAFDLSCKSVFDETTATLPNPRTTAASSVQNESSIPPSVILCQVTDYVEV